MDNHHHHPNNPVTNVATKLNELMMERIFGCGSPRRGRQDDLLLEDGAADLPTRRQKALFQDDEDEDDDQYDLDNDGIELDNENSLRPSYELYRV